MKREINLEIGQQLQNVMKEAGDLLLSFWAKPIERKKDARGFVTEADLALEELLIDRLGALVPQADFWAEESGKSGNNKSGYHWVIDPLDGTRNFANRIPYFGISVALTHNNDPIMAAVYNPILDELFYAQKGHGTFCNGKKIAISQPRSIRQAFIALGISYRKDAHIHEIQAVKEIARSVASVRHMGAVAIDLANVAIGRFDGVFFSHLSWWDVAAGMLLITQAGGLVSDLSGRSVDPSYQSCVAGSQLVFDHLHNILKK